MTTATPSARRSVRRALVRPIVGTLLVIVVVCMMLAGASRFDQRVQEQHARDVAATQALREEAPTSLRVRLETPEGDVHTGVADARDQGSDWVSVLVETSTSPDIAIGKVVVLTSASLEGQAALPAATFSDIVWYSPDEG